MASLGIWRFFLSVACFAIVAARLRFTLEDIGDGSEELLDMSHEYNENTPFWPTIEKKGQHFQLQPTQNGHSHRFGYYYHANVIKMSDHGGTHVDALNHVNKNPVDDGIDRTPLKQYFGAAMVVNISARCLADRNYQLKVSDLLAFENTHGKISDGCLLFIYSGWGAKIHNKTDFWGSGDYFNISSLQYPGVSAEAAEWIVKHRLVKLVGVETGSIDHGQGGLRLSSHVLFLSNKINVVESVANLDKLPAKGAFVFGLPMKMKAASGSPIRLVAVGWNKS
ncbi:hypothetical protein RvY_06251 [Ramazzottius varieornatus]|uniref:Cyclase n=1 Tax=Ramazzottius varieornatus TaxID=947166 RepID=A0A1D1UYF9_RAMVA|nr:hypothetical protein RvY_06251 [Ramazzottius varieornatus]